MDRFPHDNDFGVFAKESFIKIIRNGMSMWDEFLQMQINRLQKLNISFKVLPNKENELEQRWEEDFTNNISNSQKRKMTFKQCMWNVFSWDKIECLEEWRAVAAFDQQKKEGCYLFYAFGEDAMYLPKADRLKTKDFVHPINFAEEVGIDNEQKFEAPAVTYLMDIYIVDEHFTWSYVLTHEESCGPYFYKP